MKITSLNAIQNLAFTEKPVQSPDLQQSKPEPDSVAISFEALRLSREDALSDPVVRQDPASSTPWP